MSRKPVYRSGDHVRIVRSQFVERVGYPLTWTMVRDEIEANPNLREAMRLLDMISERGSVKREFVAGAAKALVRHRGFGGPERSIHYLTNAPDYTGYEAIVLNKRVVRTGTYFAPSGYDDWYEPGGLNNAKSHVLLETQYGDIEAANVEPWRDPCEYCDSGKLTGLPGNACENCMNTGLKNPTAEDLV